MVFKKVTKRWLVNGLGVVIVFLLIIEVVAAIMLHSYYYQQVQSILYTRVRSLSHVLSMYVEQPGFSFEESARDYVETFQDKEIMELQLLSKDGTIVASSTGFIPQKDKRTDFNDALVAMHTGNEPKGIWTGRTAQGEKIMSMTLLILKKDRSVCGAIRFAVCIEKIDRQILLFSSIGLLFGMAVIFFVLLSSSYFISGILNPLAEIGESAKRISQGDYSCRIEKRYDDEIGELCDTINDMAGEIANADRLQNEFISSISHELRTPLTAIKGWSETIKDSGTEDPELMKKGLQIISDETERLSGIVEELLDFSHIQHSPLSLEMEELDIYEEVWQAICLFSEQAQREGITLLYQKNGDIPLFRGDRARLKQVFVNILDNAIKYSRSDGTVSVLVMPVGNSACISISDDGIGISPKDLPNVKTKFYRANNQKAGSGIGLAVAEEIVVAHGGTLTIESKQHKETTVTIRLPILSTQGDQENE